jgi:membrane protease YdiL (CAAX protease family)
MASEPTDEVVGRAERVDVVALVVTVGVLALWNPLRDVVPGGLVRTVANLVVAAALLLLARWRSLNAGALGLARRDVRSGIVVGSAAFLAIAAVIVVAAVIPGSHGHFHAAGTRVGATQAWLRALIYIPFGTVVVEEIAFRGLILGALRPFARPSRAVLLSALLFGLWHVPDVARSSSEPWLASLGVFAATAAAGVAFAWLRLRSRSLIAPAMAHVATNSVAFLVAWSLTR